MKEIEEKGGGGAGLPPTDGTAVELVESPTSITMQFDWHLEPEHPEV